MSELSAVEVRPVLKSGSMVSLGNLGSGYVSRSYSVMGIPGISFSIKDDGIHAPLKQSERQS